MKTTVLLFFITLASLTASAGGDSLRVLSRNDFVDAAERTVNGVVSVKSFVTPQDRSQAGSYYGDPLLDFFFGTPRRPQRAPQPQQQPQQTGLGSGVIIDTDGYIVTNNHVIADAERLEVTLNDNRNFPATVVGSDPVTDLALIKIEAPNLHVIPLGDSEKLRVGEWVLAVGNPFGFTSSVTSGIVSAKARNISTATGMPVSNGIAAYIQTDAAVNRGNSGGALVNLDGELVGINTAIYSQTGTYAGCSFAIPVSIVQKVVGDLKAYGAVQRALLGIRFQELSPELIEHYKLPSEPAAGIYVASVEERSAAMEAGLAEGDVIVAIDGRPTRTTAELQEIITRYSPGDKAEVTYWRDGKKYSGSVTFRNSRGDTAITKRGDDDGLGVTLAEIDADAARRLGIRGGVAVADITDGGRFARAGVRQGFIVLSVNGNRVTGAEEVTAIARAVEQSASATDKVLFLSGIYPDGKAAYYAVPLND